MAQAGTGSTVVSDLLLTRRQGLTAAAVLLGAGVLAACSSGDGSTTTATAAPTAANPLAPTLTDEAALIALYDQSIAALPDLAKFLQPIRDQHAEHLSALGGSAEQQASATASSTLAADPTAAIATLIEAERSASKQRIDASLDATDAQTVRTLVYIAASEAAHVPALKDLNP